MSRARFVALGAVLLAAVAPATGAARSGHGHHHNDRPEGWWRPPADVRAMLADVSARNLKRDDLKLVGFGTRNTLSTQTDPNRGIGAARDWLYAEFQAASKESGGRLKVEMQTFEQPVGPRVPKPTKLTNVIAMLPGDKYTPEQRIYVVSG